MDDLTLNRLNRFYPYRHKCMVCGGEIWYPNAKINGAGKIMGTSFNTSKITLGHKLNLMVCEKCFHEKYPDLKTNFGIYREPTKYAFNMSDEEYNEGRLIYSNRKKLWINKYGEEEGLKKWNEYCKKQSFTNTFEYKHQKYGWTREQFDEYNKSRAVTKENLIKKYGEEEGLKKWDKYVARQRLTKSREYVVNKYGEATWKKICNLKRNNLANFIRRHGEQKGVQLYKQYIDTTGNCKYFSDISQIFFNELDSVLSKKYTTHYATKDKEYGKMLDDGYIKMDYFIEELNLCIEFNGDAFHGNPKIYNPEDHCFPYNKSITAGELQANDQKRYQKLLDQHGIKTIVVWECDYRDGINIEQFIDENIKKYESTN